MQPISFHSIGLGSYVDTCATFVPCQILLKMVVHRLYQQRVVNFTGACQLQRNISHCQILLSFKLLLVVLWQTILLLNCLWLELSKGCIQSQFGSQTSSDPKPVCVSRYSCLCMCHHQACLHAFSQKVTEQNGLPKNCLSKLDLQLKKPLHISLPEIKT